MSITEVYEKHKHLDRVLSDPQFCEGSAMAHVARELWLAIKEHAEQNVHLTASGAGGRGEIPLQSSFIADDPSAKNGGR
jgi:hypothetical protein